MADTTALASHAPKGDDAETVPKESDSQKYRLFKSSFNSKLKGNVKGDRSYEMIVDSIMAKVSQISIGRSSVGEESSWIGNVMSSVAALLIVSGIIMYWPKLLELVNGKAEQFRYVSAEKFSHVSVLGIEETVTKVTKEMFQKCLWTSKMKKDEIEQRTEAASFNYLLHGVPGTGKTTFVRRVAYELDILLRSQHFLDLHGGLESDYIQGLKKKNLFEATILNLESRVKFLYVTPSSITDKYIGESEKNVRRLFEELDKPQEINRGIVVMFDEADALFQDREEGEKSNGTGKALQSELLTRLGQSPDVYRPVFIFAATNILKSFDGAFVRRFSKKIEFTIPNEYARAKLISFNLRNANLSEEQIKSIILETDGYSQAFITRVVKEFVFYDNDGRFIKYDYEGLIRKLREKIDHKQGNF